MSVEKIRDYCLSKPQATESFPFDDTSLVMKVCGKMFALIPLEATQTCITLKCDHDYAIELRDRYEAVTPAYHFNKKHWNTVFLDNTIKETDLVSWINQSYDLVVKGLTKKEKAGLGIQ